MTWKSRQDLRSLSLLHVCRLAEGGMGFVDLALRQEGPVRRFYAIKHLRPHLRDDEDFQRMFLDEARLAGLVSHPNVVGVHEAGKDADGLFLVMDYVEGVSLSTLIQETTPREAFLPLPLCLQIAAQVARGLHAAHTTTAADGVLLNLVHRDVSPQNVLVGYDGIARVTDFGIAKALGNLTLTSTGLLKGNLGYMAPELLRFEPADRKSDLYALGVVLHEMLCRRRLYRGDDAAEVARRILAQEVPDIGDIRADVPSALSELMFELLARDPAARPKDAGETATRLESILVAVQAELGQFDAASFMNEQFRTKRVSRAQQISDACTKATVRRRRRPRLLALSAGLVLIAGAAGITRWHSQIPPLVASAPVGPGASIWAGAWHTCALRGGDLFCWGKNNMGQLGDGTTADRSLRQIVTPIADVVAVGGGQYHTCAVARDHRLFCWGRNTEGQLGHRSDANLLTQPLPVPGISDAVMVATGEWHTCALRSTGRVACWGRNDAGQLGTAKTVEMRSEPQDVTDVADAREVVIGGSTTCARLGSGAVVCWGERAAWKKADDRAPEVRGPTRVAGVTDAIQISMGANFACAVLAQGGVTCWGDNKFGQLGAGEEVKHRSMPTLVPGLDHPRAVGLGVTFACALLADRSVRCWGRADWGSLGDGAPSSRKRQSVPVAVLDINDAVALAVGNCHTCVRRAGGGISCWGLNESGQVGDGGTTDPRTRPVSAAGFP